MHLEIYDIDITDPQYGEIVSRLKKLKSYLFFILDVGGN